MNVPLTPAAENFVNQMLAAGYDNPAEVVEIALQRLVEEELAEDDPAYIAWIRAESAEALAQVERGETVPYDLDAILREANLEFEQGKMELNSSVIP